MKTLILNELEFANTSLMRLTVSMLCTLFLFTAHFLAAEFISQLIIFLFALLNMRKALAEGFEKLCSIESDARTLVFVSSFASLLHGFVVLDGNNYFALAALTLSFSALGEFIEEKGFGVISKERTYADRICSVALPISLVLFVVSVVVNLAMKKGMYETMRRSFSVLALCCPTIVAVVCRAVSVIFTRIAAANGVFVQNINTVIKLGAVKEAVCDGHGVVTEDEYSLYDIYSTEADKASLLAVVAAIESNFEHRFALAALNASHSLGVEIPHAENCFEIKGRGALGIVLGDKYLLGNKKLLREKKIALPEAIEKTVLSGCIPLYVVKNGEFFGMLLFVCKKRSNVDFSIGEIKKLGKRTVVIADEGREDLKGRFDILLCEREKVLQEFKKGAKIKAMVISQKPIAKADVVATIQPSDKSDLVLGSGGMGAALFSLSMGKYALRIVRESLFVSFAFSLILSLAAAFGMASSPIIAGFVTVAPLMFFLRVTRFKAPEITASEEDEMFGKINYTMHINGMNCAHCSARVKTALESLKGVSAKISLEEKLARIKCPAKTTAEELAKAVTDVGFTVVSTERV